MAHLLEQSRQRTQQYVSLSWGVLAGLMRSLDIRDQRAARHAAAVARFARDIAQAVGMGETDASSPTRPGCCTTSATSRCRTASPSAAAS